MHEHFDSTELLDLIEGDLDHASAEALRARLARDPALAQRVQAIGNDRAMLRGLEEPALPFDIMATIEPMLSRPMLMETPAETAASAPGQFRRMHRRQARMRRWRRIAVAAVLMGAAGGGLWAGAGWLMSQGGLLARDSIARNEPRPAASTGRDTAVFRGATESAAISSAGELGVGMVHHDVRPGAIIRAAAPSALRAAGPVIESTSPEEALAIDTAPILTADFALVVQAADVRAAEERVTALVAAVTDQAAMVRNFSYAHAQELAEEHRLAHAGPVRDGEPLRASGNIAQPAPGTMEIAEASRTRHELALLAQRAREELQQRRASENQDSGGGVVLAGNRAMSPGLEQQLELSSRGATHTIAVPVSHLVTLIESLALADPAAPSTSIRMLAPDRTAEGSPSIGQAGAAVLSWLNEGPQVRQAMERLSKTRSDAIVLLPVIVR